MKALDKTDMTRELLNQIKELMGEQYQNEVYIHEVQSFIDTAEFYVNKEATLLINIIETMIPLTKNNASVELQDAWRKLVEKHREETK